MKMSLSCGILLLLLFASQAQAAGTYVAAVFGSTGAGVDLSFGLDDRLMLRGMLRRAAWNVDGNYDGVPYTGDLNLSSLGAAIDYYPFFSAFRLSIGVLSNSNEINLLSRDALTAEIGDVRYEIDGELRSDLSFNPLAPFFMLGFSNAHNSDSPLSFSLELGLLSQGAPEVELNASGTIKEISTGTTFEVGDGSWASRALREELAKEEDNLNAELGSYKLYPIVSLGLSYRF